MIIATAGHVDHGKTSLVNALTGVDTDRLEEEKARGLTIDLGFAYTDGEAGARLGFVDVPGHIRFINNMLAGVSAIDHALLVVAADDGVMPQTVEHLEILNLLGIRYGTIAVTKIDRVEPDQLEKTIHDITQLVQHTFLEDAEIIPVSATANLGLDTLKLALDIAADDLESQEDSGHFRLAIDRRFSIKGSGIVVTGSVFSGTVRVGDEVLLMPQRIPVRIRSLHVQNQVADAARSGDRCAVNIAAAQLDLEDISRGNWLTGNPSDATDRADISLRILPSEVRPFNHWTPVHIHTAANHVTGRVATLEGSGILPGEEALAQLVMDEPVNLCTGDRIIIRDQGAERTVGGGPVIDPVSPRRGRARTERIAHLKNITPYSAEASLGRCLTEAGTGIDINVFAEKFNLTSTQIDEMLDSVDAIQIDDTLLISSANLDKRLDELVSVMDIWHDDNAAKAGIPVNQLQSMIRHWPGNLTTDIVNRLTLSGTIQREGNLLKRPGRGIQLSRKEQAILANALPLLAEDPLKPPVLHDLAKSLNEQPKELEKILAQVAKTGQLVRPVKNRFFVPEAMHELKARLADAASDGELSVQSYRDATGIGRNLCIEILEYFDRQGVTRRLGDVRQIIT
jgi:selenocysteine-specific elongation factor